MPGLHDVTTLFKHFSTGTGTRSIGPSTPMANRPFRADWAGWTPADLLQLRWNSQAAHYNVLGADYIRDMRRLPVPVTRAFIQ
jgi:hypothetical protein